MLENDCSTYQEGMMNDEHSALHNALSGMDGVSSSSDTEEMLVSKRKHHHYRRCCCCCSSRRNDPSGSIGWMVGILLMVVFPTLTTPIHGMVMNRSNNQHTSSSSSSVLELLSTARAIHEQRQHNNNNKNNHDYEKNNNMDSSKLLLPLSNQHDYISDNDNNNKIDSSKDCCWSKVLFDDVEEDEYDWRNDSHDEDSEDRGDTMIELRNRVVRLQSATQSEVPDMELLLQMEAAARIHPTSSSSSSKAAAFIDHTYADATALERIAMSSIPTQLPRPVPKSSSQQQQKQQQQKHSSTTTISNTQLKSSTSLHKQSFNTIQSSSTSSTTITSNSNSNSNSSKSLRRKKKNAVTLSSSVLSVEDSRSSKSKSGGVSVEQEVQLARIIQRGVQLHNLKRDFESQHQREITKSEWTQLAQLESPKELRRLVSDYRRAKNKLVTSNMGLVHAIVRDYYSTSSNSSHNNKRKNNKSSSMSGTTKLGITKEELIQEGSLGLIRAAELFDPNRGLRFSTYAYIWIKGVLSNQKLDQPIALPAREKTKWNQIQQAIHDLKQTNNNNKDNTNSDMMEQVAKATNLSTPQVQQIICKMTQTRNLLSLDYQYDTTTRSGSDSGKHALLYNDKNMQSDADLVERLHVRADVVAALARNLNPREARLMRLRYGLQDGQSRTIVECAEAMGISRARAHQLATGCLEKLRQAEDAQSLQEYLLTIC